MSSSSPFELTSAGYELLQLRIHTSANWLKHPNNNTPAKSNIILRSSLALKKRKSLSPSNESLGHMLHSSKLVALAVNFKAFFFNDLALLQNKMAMV